MRGDDLKIGLGITWNKEDPTSARDVIIDNASPADRHEADEPVAVFWPPSMQRQVNPCHQEPTRSPAIVVRKESADDH